MRVVLVFVLVIVGAVHSERVKRSTDYLIGSTNLGASATFGEQGVADCLAAGNPAWKCYSEQTGFNPQWK